MCYNIILFKSYLKGTMNNDIRNIIEEVCVIYTFTVVQNTF